MFGSRSAMASGMPLGPTFCASKPTPSHAAPICETSMPASFTASSNASTISVSASASQRSPKRAQPMPRIATRSLIPLAMSCAPLFGRQRRSVRRGLGRQVVRYGLPEILGETAVVVHGLDPEHHPHRCPDHHVVGLDVGELDGHPPALLELDRAVVAGRVGRVGEAVC